MRRRSSAPPRKTNRTARSAGTDDNATLITVRVVLVAAVVALMGAASVPTRVTAAACTKTQTKVTLGGKSTCVAARGYLPKPEVTHSVGTAEMRHLLTGDLAQAINRHFPLPHGIRQPAPFGAAVRMKAAGGVDPLVNRAITRATKRTTAGARRANDVTMSQSQSFTANGQTGTLILTGTIPTGNDGQLDASQATLDMTFNTIKNGIKVAGGVTIGITEGLKWDGPCPNARGDLRATSETSVTLHGESQPGAGVDYVRDQTNVHSHGGSSTTFKPTSRLGQISYHDTVHFVVTHDVSLLHGLYKPGYRLQTTASWTGTIDPDSGEVTLTSLTAFNSGAAQGFGSGSFGSVIAQLNSDPNLNEEFRQFAVDEGHSLLERYKDAEGRVREPNHCAQMKFDPAGSDDLGTGSKVSVQGRVGPKDGGGSSDSIWGQPTIERGQVKGIPGTSSPSQPVKIDVTGGSPDSARVTAHFAVRASSRAGVAESSWEGKQSGWLVTVQGRASMQQSCCWITSGNATATVKVVKQTVGGVTGFYGQGAFSYSGISDAGNGLPTQCSWKTNGANGTASVTITPSSDGSTLDVQVVLHDVIDATLTCPAPIGAQSVGGVLVGGYYLSGSTSHPHVTLPADGTGSAQITWSNSQQPLVSSGQLTVTAKPL